MMRYVVILFLVIFLLEQESTRHDVEGDLERCQAAPAKQGKPPAPSKRTVYR